MQRGFPMGLRRARAQAQREMNEMADEFEGVIAEIHAEMRASLAYRCTLSRDHALEPQPASAGARPVSLKPG